MTDETFEVGHAPTRTVRVGQRLCISGQGTANIFHSHDYVVKRVTGTMVILESTESVLTQRFRRHNLRSIPYQPYGGWVADTTCQRLLR